MKFTFWNKLGLAWFILGTVGFFTTEHGIYFIIIETFGLALFLQELK